MTVALVVAAVAVVIAAAAAVVLRARSSEQEREERVGSLLADMNLRMETMRSELAEAIAHAQEEARRHRYIGELGASLDLEDVIARTLEAAGALPGVDAALLAITAWVDEAPRVEGVGLTDDEVAECTVVVPEESTRLRSIALRYADDAAEGSSAVAAGLAVPLRDDAATLGSLAVFTRDPGRRFDDETAGELDALAVRAGPAVANARRFREARQLADLDSLTGLHNRRYFHETLAREVARAHRYNRSLALIVIDLDDFKAVNDRIGHLAGDAVLAEVAERVRSVVRTSDVPCRVGGDEFGVILPESTLEDADQLYARLEAATAARPLAQGERLTLSAGVAQIRPSEDPVSFFQRADEALYRAKDAGKGRAVGDSGTG